MDAAGSRFVVRAPGRVNLVGEHIDYHDLPVLPMALERGVRITAQRRNDGVVRLDNRDPAFEPVTLRVAPDPPRGATGHWGNYVRAAVAAAAPLADPGAFGGFDGTLDADLPAAAGLSSSSALVVATALAVLSTHRNSNWRAPSALRLAQLLADGERYVGTAGGGMDQSACLGGRVGHVLRVSFDPVAWTSHPLPHDWSVLIAHSGVRAEKSGAARAAYNALRTRGRSACEALASQLGTPACYRALRAAADTSELLTLATRLLNADTAAVATHVFTEADRVDAAWDALDRADASAFGAAMNASHASLTRRCGVGHRRLDELVEAARGAGALGARLTGAGFGGCIVALAPIEAADAVLEALRDANLRLGPDAGSAQVFRARAGAGARVDVESQ